MTIHVVNNSLFMAVSYNSLQHVFQYHKIGELSHRRYRGLPDIIKHFLTPYGREELRTSMSSELPEISVDPTELYSGVAINKLVVRYADVFSLSVLSSHV